MSDNPLGMECPHCGVRMSPVHKAAWDQFAYDAAGTGQNRRFGGWACMVCGRPIVGETRDDPVQGPVPMEGRYYPVSDRHPTWPDSAPEGVRQDATAAYRCYAIGEWRASATMARRAIQGACIDKEAPDRRLEEQIDWLAESDVITQQMRQVAHQLRMGGNAGAHPGKDGLNDVSERDAGDLLTFLDYFMRYVYEIPGRLAALPGGALPAEDEPGLS